MALYDTIKNRTKPDVIDLKAIFAQFNTASIFQLVSSHLRYYREILKDVQAKDYPSDHTDV